MFACCLNKSVIYVQSLDLKTSKIELCTAFWVLMKAECQCVCGPSLIHVCISFVLKGGGFGLVENVTEEVQMLKNRVELLEQVRNTHTHTPSGHILLQTTGNCSTFAKRGYWFKTLLMV